MKLYSFPAYRQLNLIDCGPTCLKMVSKYHGKNFSLNTLKKYAEIGKEGVNSLSISDAAETVHPALGAKPFCSTSSAKGKRESCNCHRSNLKDVMIVQTFSPVAFYYERPSKL